MGTAGGEPRVLLNALKPMLGVVGDIKTPQEVLRVVCMMKDAEKLMSRCVYLNILKATCRQAKNDDEKRETLEKFLATGGWGILNKWLHEFTKAENFPVLLELIDVLKILPITVDLLKQGNTGKLIKQMTKLEHGDVKKNAGGLIRQWKDMIRGGVDKKGGDENSVKGDVQSNKRKDTDVTGPPEKRLKLKSSEKKVSDSSGFMNALNAAVPLTSRKIKRRTSFDSKPNLPLDELLKPEKKSKQDEDGERTGEQAEDTAEDSPYIPGPSPAVLAANEALAHNTDNAVVVDEGSLARRKNKKKRNITWATDDKLVQVKYFELLEGERKGHHSENFSQARQHELLLEKQTLRAARRGDDQMMEKIKWCRLIPVDNAGVPNFIPGEKSREKYLQTEREKSVLAFIFLTKDSLPDTPGEPEFDPDDHGNQTQPKPIPHDEDGNIFPSKPTNTPQSQRKTSATDEEFVNDRSPTTKTPPTYSTSSNNVPKQKDSTNAIDVSPAVQNIMSQLLRNNPPYPNEPTSTANGVSSIAPSILGQPTPQNTVSSQVRSSQVPSDFSSQYTDDIPSIMSKPIPNPRGRGNGRFNGNHHRGGFNPRGGQRPTRWDGSQQGPREDWTNHNNFDENFNEGPFNDGFNDNFHGGPPFSGPPRGQHNDHFSGGGRGFHGGNHHRGGRGRPDRGHGLNDRGSFGSNRGRGGMDRGRGNHHPGSYDFRQGGNEWYPESDNGLMDRNFNGSNRGRGGRGREDVVCQHFNTPRGCRAGDRCKFKHIR